VQHVSQAEERGKKKKFPGLAVEEAMAGSEANKQQTPTKCDLTRPACGQCRRAGIACAGYDRPRTFINITNDSPSFQSAVTLPDHLARAAYDVRYFELFWGAYMPMKGNLQEHITYINPSWTDAANELYSANEALRTALLALGLGTIGRRDGQRWMIKEGRVAYVRSLGHMSRQLRGAQEWKSDSLLAASKVLGLYEVRKTDAEPRRLSKLCTD